LGFCSGVGVIVGGIEVMVGVSVDGNQTVVAVCVGSIIVAAGGY
jgi:hypothetical protein